MCESNNSLRPKSVIESGCASGNLTDYVVACLPVGLLSPCLECVVLPEWVPVCMSCLNCHSLNAQAVQEMADI